jgi:hypothetical protein
MFAVGDKLICVDASPVRSDCVSAAPLRLTEGGVYTVRSVHMEPSLAGYGVRLAELMNPPIIWSDGEEKEWSYASERFRLLDDSQPSIREVELALQRR